MSNLPTFAEIDKLYVDDRMLDEKISERMMGMATPVRELSKQQLKEIYLRRLSIIINARLEFFEFKR